MSHLRAVEFIETSTFTRLMAELVSDEEYADFQNELAERPDQGAPMRDCGGVRKVRMAARGKGKSGGARVIYYYLRNHETIYLLYVFTKDEAANLSAAGKKAMREGCKQIKAEYHEKGTYI